MIIALILAAIGIGMIWYGYRLHVRADQQRAWEWGVTDGKSGLPPRWLRDDLHLAYCQGWQYGRAAFRKRFEGERMGNV